jgi:hypothetical protein
MLGHLLIFRENHARRMIREYVPFFNYSRPHQGIDQQIPEPVSLPYLYKKYRNRSLGCQFSMVFIMFADGLPDCFFK